MYHIFLQSSSEFSVFAFNYILVLPYCIATLHLEMDRSLPPNRIYHTTVQFDIIWEYSEPSPPKDAIIIPTSHAMGRPQTSVVHEPSGLEPFEPGSATSRLESLGNRSLGGSNRGPRADSSLLAARAGSDRGPRADSTLDSSLLAVSWRFLGGSSRLVNNTTPDHPESPQPFEKKTATKFS